MKGDYSIDEERELQDFRDFQNSSHFQQSDYTAKKVRICYILVIISLILNVLTFIIVLIK